MVIALVAVSTMLPMVLSASTSDSILGATPESKSATSNEEWSLLNDFFQGYFRFVGRGLKGFIAGNPYGYITSSDGLSWESFSNIDGMTMSSADTDGETTVAVVGHKLYWCSNGQGWAQVPNIQGVEEVRRLNGKFIAVGSNGLVYLSNDGQAWTSNQAPVSVTLEHVAWNGSYYAASYEYSSSRSGFVFSVNGSLWAKAAFYSGGDCEAKDLDAGNGRFVGVGRNCTVYSDNPSSWYGLNGHPELSSITWDGEEFVSVGFDGGVYHSPNGSNWAQDEKNTDNHLASIVALNGVLVAVGEYGAVIRYGETDGWSAIHSFEGELKGIAFDGQKFCAAGIDGGGNDEPTIYQSTNGYSWQKVDETFPIGTFGPRDLIWWGGRFWGPGRDDFLYSYDCINWSVQSAPAISPGLDRIAGTSDFLVGTGYQTAFRRTLSNGWSQVLSIPSGVIKDVAANESTAVISTTAGYVYTSIDGLAWFPIQVGQSFDRITVFNNVFFANAGTRIWTSVDGFAWAPVTDSHVCHSIFFGRGLLRCFGVDGFYESLDGSEWVETGSDFQPGWMPITYGVAESSDILLAVMIDGNMAAIPFGPRIFSDNFESGDETAWSVVRP